MPTSVSAIGLGKLGAPMVAAMAARGVLAIGVDVIPAALLEPDDFGLSAFSTVGY